MLTLIDIYIFLQFCYNIERLNIIKELKKINPTNKNNDQLQLFCEQQLPINYPDMEKIIKLSIMKKNPQRKI